MPLTALDALGTLIDSTTATDEAWRTVYKTRPRSILRCRGCGDGMQAKVSSLGLRFFAHDRVRPDCPSNGESPDHRWLKSRLAAAVRTAGWTAEIEAEPRAGDIGGWRADVLAIAPEGARRVALEAQLAPMTEAVGVERTERYAQDGIETLWVTLKNAPWLWKLMGCKVDRDESTAEDDGQPSLVATRGCAKLTAIPGWRSGPQWAPVNVPLSRLIQAMLDDSVGRYVVKFLPERIPYGDQERDLWHSDAIAVAPRADARRALEQQEREERERLRREDDEARHARSIEAMHERQERALPTVVEQVRAGLQPDESLWLGVPATPATSDREVTLRNALGNERTAMGLAVWVGPGRNDLRLAAVVCPVAGRINTGLATSWSKRGTQVFVSDAAERQRVALALGWPVGRVRLVRK